MKYGVMMFSTDYAIHPAELGRAAEERGFESSFPEHTHIPSSRLEPWPGVVRTCRRSTGTPTTSSWRCRFAAAATSTIRIGTGICLVIEHDPITLAKQVATLDALSGDASCSASAAAGTARRWRITAPSSRSAGTEARAHRGDEGDLTKDEASHHGEHVSFDAIWSWPKPVQKPHPPILLGSGSARGRQRGRLVRRMDADRRTRRRARRNLPTARPRRQGRPRSAVDPITIFGASTTAQRIDEYRAAGVERVVFALPPSDRDAVLRVLDKHVELIRTLEGRAAGA